MNNALMIQQAEGGEFRKFHSYYWPYLADYLYRWKIDYILQGAVPYMGMTDETLAWNRLRLALQHMTQKYQYIFLLDADVWVADQNVDLRAACEKPLMGVRWWPDMNTVSHIQAGVLLLNNGRCLDPDHPEPLDHKAENMLHFMVEESKYWMQIYPGLRGWHEQGQLDWMIKGTGFKTYVGELPIEYNWGRLCNKPCEHPYLVGYHGERPLMDVALPRLLEDIEKWKPKQNVNIASTISPSLEDSSLGTEQTQP